MGLDSVEFIWDVEQTFGIVIPNEVAERMWTPRDVVAFVTSRVETVSEPRCLTQELFYRLRRGFREQVPALGLDVHGGLDRPLADVLDRARWPQVWAAVRASVGEADWPESIAWPGLLRDGPRTMRELVWHIVWTLPKPPESGGRWTRSRIEGEVRRLIAEIRGEKNYRLDAKLVDELGFS